MSTDINIQADFAAEAKESAIQRIGDLLRHPDDLTNKLPLLRKKIALERGAIEAQLKTAIEAQLDNAARGLDTLRFSKNETLVMKDTLVSMDGLCANAQNTIKNYNHIKKISKTHQNFTETKAMADQFKKLNDQIQRTTQLLEEDCANVIGPNDNLLLVHYQLQLLEKFRNNTMVQARGASVEILSTLSNSFKKVDVLEQSFDHYVWDLASKTLDLLKTGNGSTIVRLVKIIEMEEKLDESAGVMDVELVEDNVKSVELEFTRGRKIKAYRIKFFDVLRNSIVISIKKIADQFSDDVESLLNATDAVIDDLVLINDDLVPLVPSSYNIFRFFVLESHRAIYEMLETIITEGAIGPGSILLLLKWVRDYYGNMHTRLDVSEELLEPRLLGGREDELVTGYISLVRAKLSEWLANILNNETVHFLARSGPPETDGNGQYLLAGSVIVFKMFNQQIDVAITSSRGQLLYDVVLVCIDVLEEYQNTWVKILDQEYQKFIDRAADLSDGLPEYVMALANDALRSTEFSENIRERLMTVAEESFKVPLGNKVKELLDGFMKVSRKAYQILIDIIFVDSKPALNVLNSAPQWYDQDVMRFVVGTFDDYCDDYQSHLNEYIFNKLTTELLDRFLILYIETFKGKNVKFTMPIAAEKLRSDLNQVIEFFSKSKSAKRVKTTFDPIDKLIALIEANPRLIYIDFFSLYKAYPDINVEFIEKVLSKRSDLDKSQVKELVDGIKSKVKEDSTRLEGKPETVTIFSKINYK